MQCYYMHQSVKKLQCIPVRQDMVQLGFLNDYLAHLPMVKDSPMAVEDTKEENRMWVTTTWVTMADNGGGQQRGQQQWVAKKLVNVKLFYKFFLCQI